MLNIEVFDKLVVPVLNYGSEVLGFHIGNAIERIQSYGIFKRLLGVKKCTQNDFVMVRMADVQCPTTECIILSNIGRK